jgi:hypothetical protein
MQRVQQRMHYNNVRVQQRIHYSNIRVQQRIHYNNIQVQQKKALQQHRSLQSYTFFLSKQFMSRADNTPACVWCSVGRREGELKGKYGESGAKAPSPSTPVASPTTPMTPSDAPPLGYAPGLIP